MRMWMVWFEEHNHSFMLLQVLDIVKYQLFDLVANLLNLAFVAPSINNGVNSSSVVVVVVVVVVVTAA
jgi:hypothetical protein